MSDGSGGMWFLIDKGLILCHAVSAPTEFISWSKLILQCNLSISMDCHEKMKISDVFVMFTKLFLPHLVPKSIIIKKNSSIHSIITRGTVCRHKKSRCCDMAIQLRLYSHGLTNVWSYCSCLK